MKRFMVVFALMGLLALMTACGPAEPDTLQVMTHDSFDISEEAITAFEAQHNATVEILHAGDAGVALNQAILSKDNPIADVIYGIDNTLLGQALEADILEPYNSPTLGEIDDDLKLDPQHRALPVDYGDVCLNYDKGWFAEQNLTPPTNLEDLVKPEYRGLTVVENPATSSPGLAFLLATIGHFDQLGDYTYLDYWADMRDNDVLVVDGWEDAYWGQFTYGSGGEGQRPIVVSYASSPPVEVHFAEDPFEEAPTVAVVGDGSCFRQIEFVGILKGTQNQELAKAWVDFVLNTSFQEDIPLHMFMFPANQNAALPDVFATFAVVPDRPAEVSYEAIEANREAWIETWTKVVLR
ncbi:MAG: thiamine ABC transporter substrate-binding protein [Chloroflexi bacterium]|nr:thiamine ABC transporter substrate-binding protein [Chloroflexota bacterium]